MDTARRGQMSTEPKSDDTPGVGAVRKRLFVLCDGTWHDGVNNKRPLTNVATLARSLEGVADDNYLQVVYYDNGVGSTTSLSTRLVDGATGRGISAKIRNAYTFLANNYNFDNDEDEIFLIGFSRGAFTAQCLASFISQSGLLRRRYLYYLRGLFALWANHHFRPLFRPRDLPIKESLAKYIWKFERERLLTKVKIKACVVWDTVSNLGPPRPWAKPLSFVGRVVPRAVENAFQALALDETRAQFKPCVWEEKESKWTVVKQCWFLGSHTDIGGSGDAALGAVTLIWMIAQMQAVSKVKFDRDEIAKHLRHRYLEWDVDVSLIRGQFRHRAVLSRRLNSGQTTRPSPLWWLSGLKRRRVDIGLPPDHDDGPGITTLVHFTVRLSMVQKRNKCRPLRKWNNALRSDAMYWERSDNKPLVEETLDNHEYEILKDWIRKDSVEPQTDRGSFAEYVKALVYDSPAGIEGKLGQFVTFLRDNMIFDDQNRLAPECMYSP